MGHVDLSMTCKEYILTWKHGSRHSGVQPLISHRTRSAALASLLLDPPEVQNIGKTPSLSISFSSFSDLLSHDFFSFDTFSSLTLSTSAFPCVHIVGRLTFKLPSVILYNAEHVLIFLSPANLQFLVLALCQPLQGTSEWKRSWSLGHPGRPRKHMARARGISPKSTKTIM